MRGLWPFLSRQLRLNIVAIAKVAERQKPDRDVDHALPVTENGVIPS
jgi:hypothetical protein